MKKYFFIILYLLISVVCTSQTMTYSYTDPCTGTIKSLKVPTNGITVTYYGQYKTFTPNQFLNGDFESWANSVFSSFGGINPCGIVVGLPTAISVTQTNALSFLSVITSLQSVSDLSGSVDILSSDLNSIQGSDNKSDKKKNKSSNSEKSSNEGDINGNLGSNTESINGTSNSVGSSNVSENNEKSSDEGSSDGNNGNGSNGGSSDKSNGANGNRSNDGSISTQNNSSGGGKVNLVDNSIGSVKNSTAGSKNGNRPNILASSDFVGFNFKNSDISFGGKVSGGYTSMRWDGLRASGIMADYTSALNGPNITGFYAFMSKNRIDLISTTLTVGFGSKMTTYGTLAVGQMWKFKKPKKLNAVVMITGSWGIVSGESFTGTAAIAGGMYDFKVTKRFDIKVLGLYVYAPYVKYYSDILLKSPHVILPIVGTNINITKRFKFNINIGGAYAVNVNTLNYTIMFGTRLLL
jgi:hypothetical protein